jgi:hypothetical protein
VVVRVLRNQGVVLVVLAGVGRRCIKRFVVTAVMSVKCRFVPVEINQFIVIIVLVNIESKILAERAAKILIGQNLVTSGCLKPFALNVVKNVKCLSGRLRASQFIVVSALAKVTG